MSLEEAYAKSIYMMCIIYNKIIKYRYKMFTTWFYMLAIIYIYIYVYKVQWG